MWHGVCGECKFLGRIAAALPLLFGLMAYCAFNTVSGVGCPVKWLTGVSCAGCGMTRAAYCALTLRFDKAFYYHPLVFLLPFCAILFLFWEKIPRKAGKAFVWAAAACFLVVYAVRMAGTDHTVVGADLGEGAIMRLFQKLLEYGDIRIF